MRDITHMHQAPDYIDFSNLSPDEIARILNKHQIALSVDEALKIQHALLKRPPSFAECILWSIQGSEHCSYKSSRKHLKSLTTTGKNVILGAKEDAGIVAIAKDDQGLRYGLVVSHESHNHPSQIVPYEGAATGVGGNVRDVCCMGAEVIAVADSLRFGDINLSKTNWIGSGVVQGIGGYGNPLGIPNIAGDVYFDPGYNDNCLVTVVTLGIVREDHIIHSYAPKNAQNYVYILVGKPTDNSGFGGASFASQDLDEKEKEKNKGAVQEPNAFLQRHLLKANYELFKILQEKNLIDKVGFKDLGAGGIACASVELAESGGYGAEINLDLVPVSEDRFHPAVVLCSETQERFMWVVPPDLVDDILKHYNERFDLPNVSEKACAKVIGKIREDGFFIVHAKGKRIVNAKAFDITQGILYDRPYQMKKRESFPLQFDEIHDVNLNNTLLSMLRHENTASRAPIYETYDKQVQGRTILEAGMGDAGVLQPFNEDKYPEEIRETGVAISLDHNPRISKIDPYLGGVHAVLEAVRNVAAVGAMPLAITDCLCFGNPENEYQMGELVSSIQGIKDACLGLKLNGEPLPVIAGNVSLYNESNGNAIPASPMISCVGVIKNASNAVGHFFQKTDSMILLLGERKDELGGSLFAEVIDKPFGHLPHPDYEAMITEINALNEICEQGLLLASHDISDGGIALALAEMCIGNSIGATISIPGDLQDIKKLFSETGGFILEVSRENYPLVKKTFNRHKLTIFVIGETTSFPYLKFDDAISVAVSEMKANWENGLRDKLL